MTLDDDEIEEILDKGDVTNLFSTNLQAKRKECEAIETRNNEIQEASNFSNMYLLNSSWASKSKSKTSFTLKKGMVKLSEVQVN